MIQTIVLILSLTAIENPYVYSAILICEVQHAQSKSVSTYFLA